MTVSERSEAAQEASRRNGARSMGPRTRKGKQRSARNAVKHGLRGRSVFDREQMPDWLRAIADEVTLLLSGNMTRVRQELLDELLLACLQIDQADRLIESATERMFAGTEQVGEGAVLAFMQDQPELQLQRLARLHAYRRRFRGRRDRCLYQLFRQGYPPLPSRGADTGS